MRDSVSSLVFDDERINNIRLMKKCFQQLGLFSEAKVCLQNTLFGHYRA
jgi:hypothetical protein